MRCLFFFGSILNEWRRARKGWYLFFPADLSSAVCNSSTTCVKEILTRAHASVFVCDHYWLHACSTFTLNVIFKLYLDRRSIKHCFYWFVRQTVYRSVDVLLLSSLLWPRGLSSWNVSLSEIRMVIPSVIQVYSLYSVALQIRHSDCRSANLCFSRADILPV